jgi:hypothetical protein
MSVSVVALCVETVRAVWGSAAGAGCGHSFHYHTSLYVATSLNRNTKISDKSVINMDNVGTTMEMRTTFTKKLRAQQIPGNGSAFAMCAQL